MYESFYGLHARPFELTPDPRFLYLTPTHSEALAHIEYGLSARKGITVLIGEVGTGKTTVLRAALDRIQTSGVRCAHLSNPTLSRSEFYQLLAMEFGLSPEAALSKAQFLVELKSVVQQQHDAGGVSALVVDEAQSLSVELLEEIRLLANMESDTSKLLQVVLVGQPELADRLNEPELRQLKQRIALRCLLEPMSLAETAAYIAGRIRIAGGDPVRLFSRDAVVTVFERSQGVPRLVSVICDNALVTGFASGAKLVGRQVVLEVCRDFDFEALKPEKGMAERTEGSQHAHGGESQASVSDPAEPSESAEPISDPRLSMFNFRSAKRS